MRIAHSGKFAIVLAAALWGIVLVINWFGPGESLASVEQVELLESADQIKWVSRYPDKLVVNLRTVLYLRIEGRNIYTDVVYVPRDMASMAFERRVIERKQASQELERPTSWVGEFTILFFIVIGFIFLGYQIRQDRRFGSPRRQIAELDAAYRAGEVEEGIYREQLEDLLPKL
jgi:hypothetical protein